MRAIRLYAVLVVLPVAGVLGILRAGRHLTAPLAVGGDYAIQSVDTVGCASSRPDRVSGRVRVVQSGTRVEVRVAGSVDAVFDGRVEARRIQAVARARKTSSGDAGTLRLDATVLGPADSLQLRGTLSDCAPLGFRAFTAAPAAKARD